MLRDSTPPRPNLMTQYEAIHQILKLHIWLPTFQISSQNTASLTTNKASYELRPIETGFFKAYLWVSRFCSYFGPM